MRRRLNISFQNVACHEDHNILLEALGLNYEVQRVPADQAEVVFAGEGVDGRSFPKAITFFVPIELWWPKLGSFDYSLGFLHVRHPRYFRLPYYVFEFDAAQLVKPPDYAERVLAEKRGFCSLVVSNVNPRRTYARIRFFELLNAKKRVDSGGKALNNIGGPIGAGESARDTFIRRHRFHISFENKRWRGYVTEKITAAMAAGAIPLYWGCPDIGKEFNPRSFIDVSRFRTFEEASRHVLALAENRDALAKVLREPWFHENRPNAAYDVTKLGDWLHWAIREGKQPLRRLFPGEVAYKNYEKFRVRLAGQFLKLRAG